MLHQVHVPLSYLGVHCSFLINLFLPYWLLAWRLLSPLGKKAGEWALVSSFMPGCRPYACLSVPSLAGHRRRRNVRFCQNHVPLSCHGIVCSFLNHLHPALLATHLSASQLLEQKGWSVALVHASCLAVAFSLTSLSLLRQVIIDIEVFCHAGSMFPISCLGVHCPFLYHLSRPCWCLA